MCWQTIIFLQQVPQIIRKPPRTLQSLRILEMLPLSQRQDIIFRKARTRQNMFQIAAGCVS
jgi:hypothetical protein